MSLDKEQLKSLIQEVVQDQMQEQKTQDETPATNYMEQIRQTGVSENERRAAPAEPGLGFARFVRAAAAGHGDPERAARFAKQAQEKLWRDDIGDNVVRAMQAGDFGSAGFMLQPEFSNEIIELLRNQTVIRQAGARSMPMEGGSMTIPAISAGSQASFVGETQPIPESQAEGGHLTLSLRKLAALVPVSNELLTFSAGNQADAFIRDDIVSELSVAEDKAFYRGPGTQAVPRGLRWWVHDDNVVNAGSPSNVEEVEQEFTDLVNKLESKNVPLDGTLALFMNPTIKNRLANMRTTGGGQLAFPELRMINGASTLWGIPVYTSNSVPDDEIVLAKMADALIGESGTMEIEADSTASYVDGTGTTVSAFQSDMTVVRALTRVDFALKRRESAAVLKDVDYSNV